MWLLMAIITNAQNAETRTVSGTVVTKSTGRPMQGVTVQNGPRGTATDADGHWSLQVS